MCHVHMWLEQQSWQTGSKVGCIAACNSRMLTELNVQLLPAFLDRFPYAREGEREMAILTDYCLCSAVVATF